MMGKTQKLMYMALLVAMALALHLIERMIPVPFIAPGAKLGLANLITVIGLYTLRTKDTFQVVMVRVVMSALFAGGVSGWMYGASGAALSFGAMWLIKVIGKEQVSRIGVSAGGAVFHNVGQLMVACLVLQNIGVMLYLPFLTVAGIGTGIFVGLVANYTVNHMKKLKIFKDII